jgi:glycosyltransferase involved in cell wall biosynthesis
VDISVIIPTLNRSASLREAILSACGQSFPSHRYEIIVVDNGSTDDTAEITRQVGRSSNQSVRYVYEASLGLHNARHAGVRAARGDILVFTDDDATFHRKWLRAYADAFRKNPDMVAAGGPVRAIWEASPPAWLLNYIGDRKRFGVFSLMELDGGCGMSADNIFFGVNMAIRRSVFQKTGFHPELLGNRTIGDGESGLRNDIRKSGGAIGWVPEAIVYHHISSSRMSVTYIRKWAWHLGATEMYGRWRHRRRGVPPMAKEAIRVIRDYWRNWLRAYLVCRRRDREAIDLQFQSSLGWSKLVYLWWMLTDPLVQQALDMWDFRP